MIETLLKEKIILDKEELIKDIYSILELEAPKIQEEYFKICKIKSDVDKLTYSAHYFRVETWRVNEYLFSPAKDKIKNIYPFFDWGRLSDYFDKEKPYITLKDFVSCYNFIDRDITINKFIFDYVDLVKQGKYKIRWKWGIKSYLEYVFATSGKYVFYTNRVEWLEPGLFAVNKKAYRYKEYKNGNIDLWEC